MKVKRLVASINASFESFLNKVENHEAVAESAIAEVRESAAKVKVQMRRINAALGKLRMRHTELEAEVGRWQDRAAKLAATDEEKALLCMGRAKRAREQRDVVAAQVKEHERLANEMARTLADIEQKLHDLQLRKTSLSSRTARASALSRHNDIQTSEEIDRIFERWEMSVVSDEYREGPLVDEGDLFDAEFTKEEEQEDLKAELDALMAERRTAGGTPDDDANDKEREDV